MGKITTGFPGVRRENTKIVLWRRTEREFDCILEQRIHQGPPPQPLTRMIHKGEMALTVVLAQGHTEVAVPLRASEGKSWRNF